MPVVDSQQAFDEAANAVRAAWEAAALSQDLFLGYEGVSARPPTGAAAGTAVQPKSWAWMTFREVSGRQATFGAKPNRRFEAVGTVIVQVFAPSSDGQLTARKLSTIVQEGLEDMKTAGGVVADSVRQVPVGNDGTWYQMNVVGDLKYERMR